VHDAVFLFVRRRRRALSAVEKMLQSMPFAALLKTVLATDDVRGVTMYHMNNDAPERPCMMDISDC